MLGDRREPDRAVAAEGFERGLGSTALGNETADNLRYDVLIGQPGVLDEPALDQPTGLIAAHVEDAIERTGCRVPDLDDLAGVAEGTDERRIARHPLRLRAAERRTTVAGMLQPIPPAAEQGGATRGGVQRRRAGAPLHHAGVGLHTHVVETFVRTAEGRAYGGTRGPGDPAAIGVVTVIEHIALGRLRF